MKRYKQIILAIIVSLICIVPLSSYAATYVANTYSGIFHYQGCTWERRMSERNRAYYNNREECISAGYRPCKVCRP
jgi:methylphosphotriester-DNA--protein-cysteine methyltransferase